MRTVVITGGNRGIGAGLAKYFYDAGDSVVLASREDSGIAGDLGERAHFFECDVTQIDQIHNLAKGAKKRLGSLDVWINNSGFSEWKTLSEITEDFWDDMISVNLKGVMFGCQAAAEVMSEGASIINISSLAGKRGSSHNSVYCASKFGVNGVTQALAKELGSRGIRVNAVCPVYIRTAGLDKALEDSVAPASGKNIDQYIEDFALSSSALQRMPSAHEVASACFYLSSNAASAITGQCINVDCGVLPQ
ncbi:MAG: SDR family oxidoreductase [Verrucomicrobiota bacterium]